VYLHGNHVVITSTDCQQGVLTLEASWVLAQWVLTLPTGLVDYPRQSPDFGMHYALYAWDDYRPLGHSFLAGLIARYGTYVRGLYH
jgi:hypothetical protein